MKIISHRRKSTRSLVLSLGLILLAGQVAGLEPTDHWLQYYGLQRWQAVLDLDADGASSQEEFNYGTDPLDPFSRPPHFVFAPDGLLFQIPITAGVSFGSARLETSTDLLTWTPVPGFPPSNPGVFTVAPLPGDTHRFYRFGTPGLLNSDGDCLLDFEELNLFHTDPLKTDTDGDGVNDCDEVTLFHTNPQSLSSTGRGAISGKVVLDEDGDPATQNHPGLGGWMVFLDLDYDGQPGGFEPMAVTQADGSYLISQLDPGLYRVRVENRPGWAQVFPALSPPSTPDGYADRVVEFFDSGTGPIPGPYGREAEPLPGDRLVLGGTPQPVDPALVIGPLPHAPIVAPVGTWAHVDWLNMPSNTTVTVEFTGEEIFDGPGPDLLIFTSVQQGSLERSEVYLGSTESNLMFATTITGASPSSLDLATLNVPQPVRVLKLRSLDTLGYFPGVELVGFQAVNFRPSPRGSYDVHLVAGETVTNISFGVAGDDRPPHLFISLDHEDLRAGQAVQVTVTATDDVGISNVTLRANGLPLSLNANRQASYAPASGGLVEFAATATDTAGQTADTLLSQVVRNADGTLPVLSGLGTTGSPVGGPNITITTPVAGEILSSPRTMIGTISGTTSAVQTWRVDYALADLVNPEALSENDPDYLLLSQGNGPVTSAPLGTLAGDTLPAGAYFLRVAATDANGTTAYFGFVIGVRVDPLEIRPEIVISTPTNETTINLLTNIIGSVTSRQQVREWFVEYAPLSKVNLQNLSDNAPSWTQIAHGTNVVTNAVLALFDATLLPNDAYVIRVSAWNKNGLGWAEPLVVQVTGGAKLGNFAVDYTDVDLPLAGIPITVKRRYDSLNAARSGDFGYGWSLAVQDAEIAETVPQEGSGLVSTPFKVGTRVYLTAPDGKRIGFTFEPEVGAVSFFGASYSAIFKPDPGITYTLQVPERDTAFLSLNTLGEALLFFLPLPWNPDTYILTDRQGTSYTYDQDDGLIEIKDTNGNRVTFTESAIEHSAGPRVELRRDSAGRISQIIAPDGRIWSYLYSAAGDLIQVTYPGNIVGTFGYAATRAHFLETINDPMHGPTQRTEYDANGRVVAIIDAAGNRVEQTFNPGGFTGNYTDARGNLTQYSYDSRGHLTRSEDPLGGVTLWEYKNTNYPDSATAVIDARGNRTTYIYDERGNLLEAIYPLGKRTTYTYDDHDRLLTSYYNLGGTETYEYDSAGNIVHFESPMGKWDMTYTESGLLASALDGEGGLTRFEYDGALDLPSRVITANDSVTHLAYDAAGRLTQHTDELGNVTRFEYDSAGRMVRQIDPRGGEIRTAYDPAFPEQVSALTNQAGRVTLYFYDALGRLSEIKQPGGAISRSEYDADGNRTAVVDALGNRSEFKYDAMSRLIEEIDPLGKKRIYTYDLAGNRTSKLDRNSRKASFTYDALNRLTQERWHHPADDSILRTLTFGFDFLDRTTSASDPDATVRPFWVRVPGTRMENEHVTYPGRGEFAIAYTYDGAGRRNQMNTGIGVVGALNLRYDRDTTGNLRVLTSTAPLPPSTVAHNAWQLQFWRNPRGDLTELRRFADQNGNNPVSQTFITQSEACSCLINSIAHVVRTNQPLPDAAMTFTRDLEGAISALTEGTRNFAYGYDSAAQLTSTTLNGVPLENYAYDVNGNRTASHLHSTYVTGPGNRLTQAGAWALFYDDEGNLVTKSNISSGVVFTYVWDHRNRLTQVTKSTSTLPGGSVVTDYRYDPFNRRIAVIRNSVTNWTYYDGDQPVADYLGSETTPIRLVAGGNGVDELYSVWNHGQSNFWTLTDQLGSVRRVLAQDGSEVAALTYDSYGNPISATGTQPDAAGRFAFAGREWDADTGLYYYRARYYDPELGRFIGEDPLGYDANDENFYRYVFNSPLLYTDPFGLETGYGEFLKKIGLQIIRATARVGCSVAVTAARVAIVLNYVNSLASGEPASLSRALTRSSPVAEFVDKGPRRRKLPPSGSCPR